MPTFSASPGTFTNSSDANFRAWGSYLAARFLACGLVKTADTGQIDWTTVTTPAGVNTYQGYEIWRFDDALQASAPVYIKVEYGEGNNADGPGIRVTFGTGSNGSGTLTGPTSTAVLASGIAVAANALIIGSGSNNRFCWLAGYTAAGGVGQWFGFERTKDASGNDTVEGVLWLSSGQHSGSTGLKSILSWSGTLGDLQTSSGVAIPAIFPIGATFANGTQVGVAPILHQKGIFMNPGLNFAGYFTENFTPTGTPSVNMYGTAHVYYAAIALTAASAGAWQGAGGGTEALMLRYE